MAICLFLEIVSPDKQVTLLMHGCPIFNRSYDYKPNWTPLSTITVTKFIIKSVIGSQGCFPKYVSLVHVLQIEGSEMPGSDFKYLPLNSVGVNNVYKLVIPCH